MTHYMRQDCFLNHAFWSFPLVGYKQRYTGCYIGPSREFEGQYKLQRDQAPARLQNMSLNIRYIYL
jgi:hypothetical protein